MIALRKLVASAGAVLVVACGDGTGPAPLPTSTCSDANIQSLAVGAYAVIDPWAVGSCVRIPPAGAGGAQYLYAALGTEGAETPLGVKTPYALNGGAPGVTAAVGEAPNPMLHAFRAPTSARAFHQGLRRQERALAQKSSATAFRARMQQGVVAAAVAPPAKDTFAVCSTAECKTFVQVPASLKHLGDRVAIYLDDNAPVPGYTQNSLDSVGTLFDDHLYRIDTVAFGRESDIDNNGVVIVLLTPRVNQLSANCSESVILGYFFPLDLTPGEANSNGAEIFYGLVPDPNPSCTISVQYANRFLAPTFIHEFQHMISFNQHVLEGNSFFSEDGWLNEGLSHFAEELGGLQIPDERCFNNDCLTQFAASNLVNAYSYLLDPEADYLVAPGNSSGTLEERGAGWMFVRWFVDQFGSPPYGTAVTRALVGTSRHGAANVEAVSGQPFSTLVPLWQMANYLDNLPGFTPSSPRLRYDSWNLRFVFNSFYMQDAPAHNNFPRPYPLVPDPVPAAGYNHAGTLRAGSGRHLLITQPASGGAIDVRLTASDGAALPATSIKPRIALVRIQ